MALDTFQLSQADSRPMYVQIMDHIKQLVIEGTWPAGHGLPSIRELAVSVQVSVITVKRAYQELEGAGIIYTRQGMGSFVAEQTGAVSEFKLRELDDTLQQAAATARLLKLSDSELIERLTAVLNNKSTGEG
ncbi:GntR family transcriptional regulator [Gilvimarinus sp. SDUM040013]|uniref:GntR family transcriptional regulator n=1 Tax=Gilvimarinus gilvus TaxID=3058038 RepID=A0ABU4RVQ3_9GAMM|nr:GntR family transcriptional regulator [Gilvimarinus sp. SDUM040013]MDO3388238.1 GntR family transcriptional regulator [Gilvimarinus sp. SDUM040013]MDX6847788.1 GntR family transcriptional regulator [Gilvimarinus sp. SDUM040013]